MKKLHIIRLFAFMGIISLIWSCRPDEPGPIGTPLNKVENMRGTWTLNRVTQVDNDAVKKGFPNQRLDITELYPYKEFSLTLNVNEAGSPGTFAVNPGNAPEIINLTSGNWTLDSPETPTKITLQNGDVVSILEFLNYKGFVNNQLNIQLVRRDGDKALVSYEYEFVKK